MSKTTADMTNHFEDVSSKHFEALQNIQRAMRGESNHRNEAFNAIVSRNVELGYSVGPMVHRVSSELAVTL